MLENRRAQVSVEFLLILAGAIAVASALGIFLKSLQSGRLANLVQASNSP